MKIDLNLEEIKILINWAEYKYADLPLSTDETLLTRKLFESKKLYEETERR